MVQEILDGLAPKPGEVAVDCTLGYGGHARELLAAVQPGGRLLGMDADPIELTKTEARLRALGFPPAAVVVRRMNFAGLPQYLAAEAPRGCRRTASGPRSFLDADRRPVTRFFLQGRWPARHADESREGPASIGASVEPGRARTDPDPHRERRRAGGTRTRGGRPECPLTRAPRNDPIARGGRARGLWPV